MGVLAQCRRFVRRGALASPRRRSSPPCFALSTGRPGRSCAEHSLAGERPLPPFPWCGRLKRDRCQKWSLFTRSVHAARCRDHGFGWSTRVRLVQELFSRRTAQGRTASAAARSMKQSRYPDRRGVCQPPSDTRTPVRPTVCGPYHRCHPHAFTRHSWATVGLHKTSSSRGDRIARPDE